MVLDTPNFIVYVPNTHEASMQLGKGTDWCTAHENPDWYDKYTKDGGKLYIIKNKKTGERWQYSDDTGDFLDKNDDEFDIMSLLGQDDAKQLSKFFEKFLGVDCYNFDGTWNYTGKEIPDDLREHIEYIIISKSVTSIGNEVFSNCTSLESITIPNGVTSIGNHAFSYCESLKSITIPNSVTSIGNNAFTGDSSLKSITIPNSVTSIGSGTFSRCESLTSITIPNSVTSIGWGAFRICTSLTSITIPNSVTSIGEWAFKNCSNLKSISIPDSVASIGDEVFYDCSSLKSITIPNSVTSIGDEAFRKCTSLKSITIPDSVTSIGDKAFDDCKNLIVYTDNKYVIDYCEDNGITVKPLKAKTESYKPFRLKIREF